METITVTSLIVIGLTIFLTGYVLGVEHGAAEARREQDGKQ